MLRFKSALEIHLQAYPSACLHRALILQQRPRVLPYLDSRRCRQTPKHGYSTGSAKHGPTDVEATNACETDKADSSSTTSANNSVSDDTQAELENGTGNLSKATQSLQKLHSIHSKHVHKIRREDKPSRPRRSTPLDLEQNDEESNSSSSIDSAAEVVKTVLEAENIPVESLDQQKKRRKKAKKDGKPGLENGEGFQSLRDALSGKKTFGVKVSGTAKAKQSKPANTNNAVESSTTTGPGKKAKKSKTKKPDNDEDFQVHKVDAKSLSFTQHHLQAARAVPNLHYGLDRVLFNPGVHYMQDPRSKVYNFDPYLASIMPVNEFDFSALKDYITSSKDTELLSLAHEHKKKYTGSTSSMSSMLAHFHYLLSAWRPINPAHTSRNFRPDYYTYTGILRAPAATFLFHRDGVYAIDADKEFDDANVLSLLGKSMEKLLTIPKVEYEKYRRSKTDRPERPKPDEDEAYHYTGFQDMLIRSQLDARHNRLPKSGMFDLKTRAVVTIRMDAKGYQKGQGYEIRDRIGQWESFEREYFDMIRSAFLKYSLQVRMGRMDGIFVAYHNTQRIFGFQYISLEEMDLAIHGTQSVALGDKEYALSLHLLNDLLNRATARFPGRSLRIHVETRETKTPLMYFFAKPVEWDEINEIQTAGKASVDAFVQELTGLVQEEAESAQAGAQAGDEAAEPTEDADEHGEKADSLSSSSGRDDSEVPDESIWDDVRVSVEDAVESDELGLTQVREAIEEALEESGLLHWKSPKEARAYVDTLLETIRGEGASDSSHEAEDSLAESTDDASDGTLTAEIAAEFEKHPEQPPVAEVTEETTDEAQVDNEKATSSDEPTLQEDGYRRISSQPERDNISTNNKAKLKALIRRMTEKVDDKPLVAEEDSESVEQNSTRRQLVEFKRILSELVAQSKESPAPEKSTSDDGEDSTIAEETCSLDNGRDGDKSAKVKEEPDSEAGPGEAKQGDELLGLILTVRNKVNGNYVTRPNFEDADTKWTVEYSVQEMAPERAKVLYEKTGKRRAKALQRKDQESQWYQLFNRQLPLLSEKGAERRKKEDALMKKRPVHVLGVKKGLKWEDVFPHKK